MKILVATDGSKPAMHAVKYAVKLLRSLTSTSNAITLIGIKHDMEVRTGHIAHEIARSAKAGKFDLIALGAKGRGAIAYLLLGSVAQRVLTLADMPVVLVK